MATYTKINTDTAFNIETGKDSVGVVCRDEVGRVLASTVAHIYAPSPLVAEALGLLEALQVARTLNLQRIIIEADNLELIKACRGNKDVRSIQGIISDIIFLRSTFESCGFTWIRREGNKVAHEIATLCNR